MARTIPVDEVIAEACTILKHVTEQEKIFMRQWAYTAMREIGSFNLNIKVTPQLFLEDWSVKKPDDLLRTNDIALYGSDGSEIVHTFKGYASGNIDADEESVSGRIHQDIRNLSRDGRTAVAITESENYFNVEEFNGTDSSGVYMFIRYYALPLDNNGLPKIPDFATLAIIFYIRAMWAMRDNSNQNYIESSWNMWKIQRAKAEGRGKTPDMIEGKAIVKTINSMIQKAIVHNQQF